MSVNKVFFFLFVFFTLHVKELYSKYFKIDVVYGLKLHSVALNMS